MVFGRQAVHFPSMLGIVYSFQHCTPISNIALKISSLLSHQHVLTTENVRHRTLRKFPLFTHNLLCLTLANSLPTSLPQRSKITTRHKEYYCPDITPTERSDITDLVFPECLILSNVECDPSGSFDPSPIFT